MCDPDDAGVLLHALGLDERRHEPWRNHYVAGPGHHAQAAIERLVAAGLMREVRSPGFLPAGDQTYIVTDEGKTVAAVERRRLYPPRKRSAERYHQWLEWGSDAFGVTFGEFLKRRLYRLPS